MLRRLLFGGVRGNAVTVDLGLAILRIATGLALCTIFDKLLPVNGVWGPRPQFIEDVANMGFPSPTSFAWMAVVGEFFAGALLMLGLFARPAAVITAGTTCVAAFIHHEHVLGDGLLAAAFFLVSLTLILTGPGALSIDFFMAGGEHPLDGHAHAEVLKQQTAAAV